MSDARRVRSVGGLRRAWPAVAVLLLQAWGGEVQAQASPLKFLSAVPWSFDELRFEPAATRGEIEWLSRYEATADGDDRGLTHGQRLEVDSDLHGHYWRPWFMAVDAHARLDLQHGDGTDLASGVAVGSGLRLFPVSRFPFAARWSVRERRDDAFWIGGQRDELRTELELEQSYTSRDRRLESRGRVELRNIDRSSTDGKAAWDRNELRLDLQGRYRLANGSDVESNLLHQVDLTSDPDAPDRKLTVLDAEYEHRRTPRPDLSVDERAFATFIQDDLDGAVTRVQLMNLSANGRWRPPGKPYTGSFNANLDQVYNDDAAGDARVSVAFNATGHVDYRYSRALRIGADVLLSHTRSDADGDDAHSLTNQSIDASYRPEGHAWHGFDYRWHADAGVRNSLSDEDDTQGVDGGVGHELTRRASAGGVQFSFRHGARTATAADTDGRRLWDVTLDHSGALNWSRATPGGTSSVNVSFSDDRRYLLVDEDPDAGEIGNLDRQNLVTALSHQQRFGRRRSLLGSGAFTVSRTHDSAGDDRGTEITSSLSVSVNYSEGFFFRVPNLTFDSTLTLDYQDFLGIERGRDDDPQTLEEEESVAWQNALRYRYRIGRLRLFADLELDWDDEADWQVLGTLRLVRDFGR